jgi:hypothetical protein
MAERECPLSVQPRCSLPRVLDWEYVLLREHVSTMTGTRRRRQNRSQDFPFFSEEPSSDSSRRSADYRLGRDGFGLQTVCAVSG